MKNIKKIALEIISRFISDLSGPISIDLTSWKLDLSRHGDDRLLTENVSEKEISSLVKQSLPLIIQDYANGKIDNNAQVLVSKDELNVVGTIIIEKEKIDLFRVITISRKKDFKPKPGTKQYII